MFALCIDPRKLRTFHNQKYNGSHNSSTQWVPRRPLMLQTVRIPGIKMEQLDHVPPKKPVQQF